nr:MAG TPA: hypothetical protein [Caudoviricetes sp.]
MKDRRYRLANVHSIVYNSRITEYSVIRLLYTTKGRFIDADNS